MVWQRIWQRTRGVGVTVCTFLSDLLQVAWLLVRAMWARRKAIGAVVLVVGCATLAVYRPNHSSAPSASVAPLQHAPTAAEEFTLGKASLDEGHREEALDHFTRAIAQGTAAPPDSLPPEMSRLLVIVRSLRGEVSSAQDRPDEAIQDFRAVITAAASVSPPPADAELAAAIAAARLGWGQILLDVGQAAEALPHLDEAIQAYRGLARTAGQNTWASRLTASLFNRGRSCWDLGRITAALEDFTTTIVTLEEVDLESGADCQNSLATLAMAHQARGRIQRDQGHAEAALNDLDQAVHGFRQLVQAGELSSLRSSLATSLYLRASLYLDQDRTADAWQDLGAALDALSGVETTSKAAPRTALEAMVRQTRARICLTRGDAELALQDLEFAQHAYRRLIQDEKQEAWRGSLAACLCTRAGALLQRKRTAEALADFTAAIDSLQGGKAVTDDLRLHAMLATALDARARIQLGQGEAEAARRDLDGAIVGFEQLVQQEGSRSQRESLAATLCTRANLALEQNDHNAAQQDYDRAIDALGETDVAKDDAARVTLLAVARQARAAVHLGRNNAAAARPDLDLAIAAYRRLVYQEGQELDRCSLAASLCSRANGFLEQANPVDAFQDFEAAIKALGSLGVESDDVQGLGLLALARLGKGQILLGQGKAGEASTELDTAVSVYSLLTNERQLTVARGSWALSLCERGSVRLEQGLVAQAIDDFSAAVKAIAETRADPSPPSAPILATARFRLGTALRMEGKLSLAMDEFSRAIEIWSARDDASAFANSIATAHYSRSLARSQSGQIEEAIHDLEEVIAILERVAEPPGSERVIPQLAAALNDLAWLRAVAPEADLRDGAEAVDLATRALDLAGRQDPLFLATIAAALAEAGDFEEAVKIQEQTLGCCPEAEKQGYGILLEMYKAKQAYHLIQVAVRKWLTASGDYWGDAELADLDKGKVSLRRLNGDVATLPVEEISIQDREYLASLIERGQRNFLEKFNRASGEMARDDKSPGAPIIYLKLAGSEVTGDTLEQLDGLAFLRRLVLQKAAISNADLVHLGRLPRLKTLEIAAVAIDNGALEHLVALASLKSVSFRQTGITVDDVKLFRQFCPEVKVTLR
ncbi:MAG: tetratricopeptide repeat protein [Planctomycetota bacterium]|nr:tetratricopeptide repeat protein [Planctomycetota bacterium]